MIYTIFAFFTACLQVAIICKVLNHLLEKRIADVRCLSGILFLVSILPFARLILPLESYFTYEIKSTKILPIIYDFFRTRLTYLPITRMQFFIIIWALVSIAIFSIQLKNHYKFARCFKVIPSCHIEYSDVLGNLDSRRHVLIKKTSIINEPMIFGLFRPTILIPNNSDLDEKDMGFILKHELAHLYHHDLVFKWFLEIVCAIYWWIPPIRKLKDNVYFIMELRADGFVIKDHQKDERIEYLLSLLKVCAGRNKDNRPMLATPFCYYGDSTSLTRRFHKISIDYRNDEKTTKRNSLFAVFLSAFILLISYLIVIQPDYKDSKIEGNSFEISSDLYYLVPNTDGGYELHFDGQFIGNIDHLDDELEKLPVINFGG